MLRDFLGGPVAKTTRSQFRGPGFVPWSGNSIPHATDTEFECCDLRSHELQLRPRAAERMNNEIRMAESLCRAPETINIVNRLPFNIK